MIASDREAVGDEPEPSVASLLTGIVADIQALMQQEIALATHELREEFASALTSALRSASAGVVIALGVGLLGLGLALALSRALDWPPWAGFVAVGAALSVVGGAALRPRLARTALENPL
jgi:uncharacterized membrane protein YqjE